MYIQDMCNRGACGKVRKINRRYYEACEQICVDAIYQVNAGYGMSEHCIDVGMS